MWSRGTIRKRALPVYSRRLSLALSYLPWRCHINSNDLEKHYPKNKSCWRKHKITPTKIVLHEPRNGNFNNPPKSDWKFEAEIDLNGYVHINIYTRDTKKGEKSNLLRGKECYQRMFNHFENSGHPILGWKGWMINENYKTIKQAMKNGLTPDQALLKSITAQFWKEWADQHDPKYNIVVEQAKNISFLSMMKFSVRFEKCNGQ